MAENDLREKLTMSKYHQNKARARTFTTTPTLTDQAAARETDINVIVGRMLPSGTIPGLKNPGIYADWTSVPTDLRGLFEQARSLVKHRRELPEELRHIPLEQLVHLTNEQIVRILTPAQPDKQTPPTEDKPK